MVHNIQIATILILALINSNVEAQPTSAWTCAPKKCQSMKEDLATVHTSFQRLSLEFDTLQYQQFEVLSLTQTLLELEASSIKNEPGIKERITQIRKRRDASRRAVETGVQILYKKMHNMQLKIREIKSNLQRWKIACGNVCMTIP